MRALKNNNALSRVAIYTPLSAASLAKMVRSLIYIAYFTLIFTSIIIAFINLPPIFDQQPVDNDSNQNSPPFGRSSRERIRGSNEQKSEKIPENQKPFRWMEAEKSDWMDSAERRPPQYRNLSNLLRHKVFLSKLSELYANLTAPKKLPFSGHNVNPVVANFYQSITSDSLYPVNSPWLDWVKTLLKSNRIVYAENKPGGSQLKLSVKYEANLLGLLKPMRLTRDQQTFPDHFYFVDLERHNAEIASFHLDQLLDFRRAPPVVGRWINLTEMWKISGSFNFCSDPTCGGRNYILKWFFFVP